MEWKKKIVFVDREISCRFFESTYLFSTNGVKTGHINPLKANFVILKIVFFFEDFRWVEKNCTCSLNSRIQCDSNTEFGPLFIPNWFARKIYWWVCENKNHFLINKNNNNWNRSRWIYFWAKCNHSLLIVCANRVDVQYTCTRGYIQAHEIVS